MSKRDYYDILGVAKNASEDEIKTAYRKLASKFHPDKLSESEKAAGEAKFKEAKEAYETLSDSDKRQQYDNFGHTDPHQSHFTHRSQSGNIDIEEIMRQAFGGNQHFRFDDGFFGHSGTRAKPALAINISLENAYSGRTVIVDKTTIHIPKGIRSGTKLFAGGNLYRVDIYSHHKFKRANDDLLVDVEINAIEAMLGVEATLAHLDGTKLQFSIPQGIQPGQIIKLSGKGMKNPETDKYGDMLVRITIRIPKNLTDVEKVALKELDHRDSVTI